MKVKRIFCAGVLSGILIGWGLGFLRIPYMEAGASISAGVFIGFTLVIIFFLLLIIGNPTFISARKNHSQTPYPFIRIAAAALLAGAILACGILIYRQGNRQKMQIQKQSRQIEEMTAFVDSSKKSEHVVLANSLLAQAHDELKNSTSRQLSDETIDRIVFTLNHFLKPYRFWEGDSLSENELSPGRGYVLLGLKAMHVDSVSFNKIKLKASFSGADLRGADLHGFDLSGADLKRAVLKDADLNNAVLEATNLSEAVLWGANLNGAKMNRANLKRANLNWAQLNGAEMKSANVDGAAIENSQLQKTDLSGATVRWANASGALLNEAILDEADLAGVNLTKANLSSANLRRANFGKAVLSEANLNGANLNKVAIEEENWFDKLEEWRVIGMNEIRANYLIVTDTAGKYKESKYCLEEKNTSPER